MPAAEIVANKGEALAPGGRAGKHLRRSREGAFCQAL
jgi:hypothetical protein